MTSTNGAATDWAKRDARVVQHPHGNPQDPERLVLVRGKGSTLWDAEGREYIDAHAGALLTQVGHGREELAKVAAEQMSTLMDFYAPSRSNHGASSSGRADRWSVRRG